MNDHELITLLKHRDDRGLDAFSRKYSPLIRYIIAPILPDSRDQEECLSDVLLRIWDKIPLYDAKQGSLSAWLTVIVRHTALNYARKTASNRTVSEIDDNISDTKNNPEELILKKERNLLLEQAIRQLLPWEQTLFYRKYYYMQSTAQIANEMSLSEKAVESRLYRLKGKLKKKLEGDLK